VAQESANGTGPEVELLHALGGVVTVSSTVENSAHRPAHLVDGDLSTAWNARTGELNRSWISIEFPTTVQLTTVKLTSGFTGTGSRGEDYFAMNHRVGQIRVSVDGRPLGEFNVDTERRDRQAFPINQSARSLRIEITATRPGSKKKWSEVCVSELEIWGRDSTAKPGTATPLVRVDASHEQRCPGKAWLSALVRASSSHAAKTAPTISGCYSGRFPEWRWYVTASVNIPAVLDKDRGLPIGDPLGQYYAIRALFDYGGQPVAVREDEEDPAHPRFWESVTLNDTNGDHVDEIVEELTGHGGVKRRFRRTHKLVGAKLEEVESKVLGEYEPSGEYVPY
jgi:hypothetical protein